jgi:hypothetical protein
LSRIDIYPNPDKHMLEQYTTTEAQAMPILRPLLWMREVAGYDGDAVLPSVPSTPGAAP